MHNRNNLCYLLHNRIGHIHHLEMPIMREIGISVLEFNIEQYVICREYMLGKYAKVTFPSSEHGSKGTLDLVHCNVFVLKLVESIKRSVYYIFLIYEFSHKIWI